jgi:hypothetical protein
MNNDKALATVTVAVLVPGHFTAADVKNALKLGVDTEHVKFYKVEIEVNQPVPATFDPYTIPLTEGEKNPDFVREILDAANNDPELKILDTTTETPEARFERHLRTWLEGAQKLVDDDWNRSGYTHAKSPLLSLVPGKRYVKVIRQDRDPEGKVRHPGGSAHAFIDATNGDVLKPASWKAPAKHARGNIYDAKNGLGTMSAYGPNYLR